MACALGIEQDCNECRMCGNGKGGKKMTNFERIKGMSVEELAELITSGEWSAICHFCKYYGSENCYIENEGASKNCVDGIKEWLESECDAE